MNMKYTALPILAVLLALTSLADDITLIDGKNLKNAKVIRREEGSIVVSHSSGVVTLTPSDLPQESAIKYFPAALPPASNTTTDTEAKQQILHFSQLSQHQKEEIIESLSARYVDIPEVGLVEVFNINGSRSLNASELGYRYIHDTISQTIGADEYLIADNTLKIRIPGNTSLVDDSPIAGIAKNDGTYNYVTVMGAPRRIKAYEMIPTRLPQIEDFVEAMKTNIVFQARIESDIACDQCNGQGFSVESKTVSAGPVACSYCKGRGTIERREREERDSSKIYVGEASTYRYSYDPCPNCNGTGQRQAYANQTVKTPCPYCTGKGTVKGPVVVDVTW